MMVGDEDAEWMRKSDSRQADCTLLNMRLTSQVVKGGPVLSEPMKLASATPLSAMSMLSGLVYPPYVSNVLDSGMSQVLSCCDWWYSTSRSSEDTGSRHLNIVAFRSLPSESVPTSPFGTDPCASLRGPKAGSPTLAQMLQTTKLSLATVLAGATATVCTDTQRPVRVFRNRFEQRL